MCRILAYVGPPRALTPYLVGRERTLQALACAHNDGWGVATWGPEGRVVRKAPKTAQTDPGFAALARRTTMSPVVWHVRHGNAGGRTMENTHPFAYGKWAFVHNGTVKGLVSGDARAKALARLGPGLRENLRGVTDSELLFHLVLEELVTRHGGVDVDLAAAARAMRDVTVRAVADSPGGPRASDAMLVMGDGHGFALYRHAKEFEHATADGGGELLASEPVGPEALWRPLAEGEALVADAAGLRKA